MNMGVGYRVWVKMVVVVVGRVQVTGHMQERPTAQPEESAIAEGVS